MDHEEAVASQKNDKDTKPDVVRKKGWSKYSCFHNRWRTGTSEHPHQKNLTVYQKLPTMRWHRIISVDDACLAVAWCSM